MPRTTRVLIADSSLATLNEVAAQLRAAGCLALIEMSAVRIRERARAERPDVMIVGRDFPSEELHAAVDELRHDPVTRRIPLIVAGRDIHGAACDEALLKRIDGIIELPLVHEELQAKLSAAIRLKIMRAELLRRNVSYGRYGIDSFASSDESSAASRRVLLVQPDEPANTDTDNLDRLSDAIDGAVERIDRSRAIGALLEGQHDAVVASGNADADAMQELCADIRRHSALFHLPIIYVASEDGGASRVRAFAQGASDVLVLRADPSPIRNALELAMRQATMRRRLQAAYRSGAQPETNDPTTGLFSLEFLHKHLDLLIEDAFRWDLSLSVITCVVPELAAVRHDMGREAGATLQRTLAGLISRLIRGEDLCAGLGDHSFCIVTPESSLEATAPIMSRLRGVIDHTEFGVLDVSRPIMLHAELGSAEFKPGDSIESLLGRAQDMALRAAA